MKKGEKYNSFYDKIKDHLLRKLLYEKNQRKKDRMGEYSNKYKALVKAKKDITDKIKESLDGALTFSEIIQLGLLSKTNRINYIHLGKVRSDKDLSNFDLLNEENKVSEMLEDYNKEFISDIFDENIIQRIINAMFFFNYSAKPYKSDETGAPYNNTDEFDRSYRIKIAKIMANHSIRELKKHLDFQYSKLLRQDLDKAIEICNTIH